MTSLHISDILFSAENNDIRNESYYDGYVEYDEESEFGRHTSVKAVA
jgi:hypothetical protein